MLAAASSPPPSVTQTTAPQHPSLLESEATNTKTSVGRDQRLDFFRGLALLMIFVDHVSGNRFAAITLQSMGFADAAEVFVFIAGMAGIYAYRKTFLNKGFMTGSLAVFSRIRLLYLAHLMMVVGVIILAGMATLYGTGFDITSRLGLAPLLLDPAQALLLVPLLGYMPHYLDILPLYVVLLATLPLIIASQRVHTLLPLAVAATSYVYAAMSGLTLPVFGGEHGWFLNPFSWLLLFTLGATAAKLTVDGFWARLPRMAVAITTVLASAYVVFALLYAAPWRVFPTLEPYVAFTLTTEPDKAFLSWHRLIDLLAKVWLVAVIVPRNALFMSMGVGAAISRAGRNSLPLFVAGTFMALVGSILLFEAQSHALAHIGITFGGVSLLLAMGWKLEGGSLRSSAIFGNPVSLLRRAHYKTATTK